MKKKIPISILLQIEDAIKQYKETGTFVYTGIGKAQDYHDLEHDIVVYAIELAHKMPYDYILSEIERYDVSCPKLNELKFIDDIGTQCKAKRGEVIERIQHVRRIRRARLERKEND